MTREEARAYAHKLLGKWANTCEGDEHVRFCDTVTENLFAEQARAPTFEAWWVSARHYFPEGEQDFAKRCFEAGRAKW